MPQRINFEHELEILHDSLIQMCSYVETAITDAIRAMETCDKKLAKKVYENDSLVNNIEKSIESQCMTLLLRQQPVARDLRTISTALKMITDLERIGDQAQDIAEITMQFPSNMTQIQIARPIPKMAEIATAMVKDSVKAFIDQDLELAQKVQKTDDQVDALFISVRDELVQELTQGKLTAGETMDIMMIVKYLERIADHAVNIAEWVEFCKTGIYKSTQII